jgi:drug/metabolite transporter (DMT)-like permease
VPESRRTDLVLVLVAVVWGSSYVAAKSATAAVPVLVVLFGRNALSALIGGGIVAARRPGRGHRYTRDELRIGVVLGVTQASVLALETFGVARTSAANAGLIISLTIVLTPLADRLGRPGGGLPGRFYAAGGGCVLAVGLLMAGNGIHTPGVGDLLMLAAAVVRAGHVSLVGRLASGPGVAIRPLQLTVVQVAVGTLLFLVPAAPSLPDALRVGAAPWLDIAYLAVFCSVFAFLAQTWAVQHTSASRASLLLGTEPVWAVATSVALGGEHLAGVAVAGAALMVAGTYWGQSIERRHRTTAPTNKAAPIEESTACLITTPTTA